jgi:hypothetical protein
MAEERGNGMEWTCPSRVFETSRVHKSWAEPLGKWGQCLRSSGCGLRFAASTRMFSFKIKDERGARSRGVEWKILPTAIDDS